MRLKLVVAYDGTAYSGWQIQEKPFPPPTIQGALEAAFLRLTGQKIRVTGSGRTDAGVHALGQVAHADAPARDLPWQKSLNSVLPADIRVGRIEIADPDFHARKDAIAKTYIYQIWPDKSFMPPLLRGQAWQTGALNLGRMRQAAQHFLGRHDFAALQNSGTPVNSTVRDISRLEIDQIRDPILPAGWPPLLRISVTASGFLKQMARNMAGLLVYAGLEKIPPEAVPCYLAGMDRRLLPSPTAPAHGLILKEVIYGES